MNRRRVTAVPSLLVVALAPLVGLAAGPPASAVEECRSRAATIVGTPGGTVVGTPARDVVVTNGAAEVDTLGGNDLVCVTNSTGGTAVDTGSGNDEVWMTDGTATWTDRHGRRAAGEVEIELGEGNDTFFSYAFVRDEGVGPGGAVDLGPGRDRAIVRVDDSNSVGTPAGTTGALDLAGGSGPDWILFSTIEMVEMVEPEDGDIDIDKAAGTATLAGRTEVAYAGFESEQVMASGRFTYHGTDGPDRVEAAAGTALIKTGPGSDRIDLVQGLPEYQDEYTGKGGPTRIYAGAHGDVVRVAAFGYSEGSREDIPVVLGGSGADTLIGGRARFGDITDFGAVAIRAYGEEGNDRILGGDSTSDVPGIVNGDVLVGGPGNDVIRGFRGPDTLYGNGGDDRLDGGAGRDTAYGGTGRDVCATEVRTGCER